MEGETKRNPFIITVTVLTQRCSWTWTWWSQWSTASGWRRLQHSWFLYAQLPCCHLQAPPLRPPGTCHGSTLGCCLPFGRRSAPVPESGRSPGLFHGCPPRFSLHHDHHAGGHRGHRKKNFSPYTVIKPEATLNSGPTGSIHTWSIFAVLRNNMQLCRKLLLQSRLQDRFKIFTYFLINSILAIS